MTLLRIVDFYEAFWQKFFTLGEKVVPGNSLVWLLLWSSSHFHLVAICCKGCHVAREDVRTFASVDINHHHNICSYFALSRFLATIEVTRYFVIIQWGYNFFCSMINDILKLKFVFVIRVWVLNRRRNVSMSVNHLSTCSGDKKSSTTLMQLSKD